jgi:hypothetical protein
LSVRYRCFYLRINQWGELEAVPPPNVAISD